METEYPDAKANSTEFEYFPAISTVNKPMRFIIIEDNESMTYCISRNFRGVFIFANFAS